MNQNSNKNILLSVIISSSLFVNASYAADPLGYLIVQVVPLLFAGLFTLISLFVSQYRIATLLLHIINIIIFVQLFSFEPGVSSGPYAQVFGFNFRNGNYFSIYPFFSTMCILIIAILTRVLKKMP